MASENTHFNFVCKSRASDVGMSLEGDRTDVETHGRNHARRRHRQPGPARGDSRARCRRLRRRLRARRHRLGVLDAAKAMPCPSAPSSCCAKHKLGLFGAITSKPKKEADAELSPALKGKGYTYFSPIVTMRQHFNLDICMRPCHRFPGNPLNFIRKKPGGGFEEPQVERRRLPPEHRGAVLPASSGPTRRQPVRDALALAPEVQAVRERRRARTWRSRCASSRARRRERICRAAFEHAKQVRLQER